jgi:HK97 family phage portal protein
MHRAASDAGFSVEPVNATDYARACGLLLDAVDDERLRHLARRAVSAIKGATTRALGDVGVVAEELKYRHLRSWRSLRLGRGDAGLGRERGSGDLLMRLWPTRNREGSDLDMVDVGVQPQVAAFTASLTDWSSMFGVAWSPRLQDRVWVANRCMQLNSQQIAQMPLRFFGSYEPAWVSNPDPVWYPNGVGDAVFAATWSMYGWGDAFVYITDRYANGFPAAWTVLAPETMSVQVENGERVYRSQNVQLDPDDVVQISRDPRGGLKGTSALSAYAGLGWGMIGAGELGRTMTSGGGSIPYAVLKSKRKLTDVQAQKIQEGWINARARSQVGAPAVLPPEIDLEQLSFSAQDLALLDLQEFDARAIASAFSVPAFMLNMPLAGGLTYQNPETLFEVWWRTELRPAAGRIQRALSANMLPRGSWVEFDARAALAPTFQGLVTAWLDLLKGGVVTADEVRAAVLHLPPMTEGEALADLTEPPTAAASPNADTPETAIVQELRPAVMSS